jgi:GT2 family glycosyltransferase
VKTKGGKQEFLDILLFVDNEEEELIAKSIDSVLKQEYSNWTLHLVVNKAYEHKSESLLKKYAADSTNVILHVIDERNLSEFTNDLLHSLSGAFVSIMHPYSILKHSAISMLKEAAEKNPNIGVIYSDEVIINKQDQLETFLCKPSYSPDLLMAMNYIGNFCIINRYTLLDIGGVNTLPKHLLSYDVLLRMAENKKSFRRINTILCESFKCQVIDSDEYVNSTVKVIASALDRRNITAEISKVNSSYRIRYEIVNHPLVTIIIPIKDKVQLLKNCIRSIFDISTYTNIEIIIVDNNSIEKETQDYLKELLVLSPQVRIIHAPIPFNYSKLNNLAVEQAKGDYFLFLNNDIEVISSDWIEEMLGYAQLQHVGAVGAKLLFQDDTIQHGGVITDHSNLPGHALYKVSNTNMVNKRRIYENDMYVSTRNYLAVTGACMMIDRKKFKQIDGFDEELDVSYNDVDLCLKLWAEGYFNVWTPHATLYHYESTTRRDLNPPSNVSYFLEKWDDLLSEGDPYNIEGLTKDHYLEYIHSEMIGNRKVLIWGAGTGGEKTFNKFQSLGIPVHGFIDKKKEKWNESFLERSIYPPTILDEVKKYYVVIGSQYQTAISSELEMLGFMDVKDYTINPWLWADEG